MNETYNETPSSSLAGGEVTYKNRAEARAARRAGLATETPNRVIPWPKVRLWAFTVLASAGPLVVFYGLGTADEVALWLGLGATILGTPASALAAANVPR